MGNPLLLGLLIVTVPESLALMEHDWDEQKEVKNKEKALWYVFPASNNVKLDFLQGVHWD